MGYTYGDDAVEPSTQMEEIMIRFVTLETDAARRFHGSMDFLYQRSYHGFSVPCLRSTPLTSIESASGASAILARPSVAAAQEKRPREVDPNRWTADRVN
jgi:hypothetical protein